MRDRRYRLEVEPQPLAQVALLVGEGRRSCSYRARQGARGGFGAFVLHFLAGEGALDRGLKVRTLTLPDVFQDQDKPEAMVAQAGLDADGIVGAALAALGRGAGVVEGGVRA